MENRIMAPQKIKHRITVWSSKPTSEYTAKRTESRVLKRYLYTTFKAALFIIAKRGKQPKCPSTDEWINKMWYRHTMEYYSALKRKEILTDAVTWMNLEDLMLNEISRSCKTNTVWLHSYQVSRRVKFIDTDSRMVVTRDWGRGQGGELWFNEYRVSVLQDKKVLESVVQQCERT